MKKGKNTVLNSVCQNFVIVFYNHPTSIVNDIETKAKTLDIEAYYRNKSKMFWFGPLKIGTEAERFGLVRIFLYQKQFVTVLAHRFWDEANQFDLVQKLSEAKRNLPM